MNDCFRESIISENIKKLFHQLIQELEIHITLRVLCVEYGIMRACVISYTTNDLKILETILKHLPHLKFKLIDQGFILTKINYPIPFTGYDYIYLEDLIESPCKGDQNEKNNVTLWVLYQNKKHVIYDIICDKIDLAKRYKIDKLIEKIQKLIDSLEEPIELFSEITQVYSLSTLIFILEHNTQLNYDIIKSLILEFDFHQFSKLAELYETGDRLPNQLLLQILYYIRDKFPALNSREKYIAINHINDYISNYFRRCFIHSRKL